MMLSRRRGEAWAEPESDYSKSRPKGHCQPWTRLRKSSGKRLDGSHAGDRAPATKQFSLRRNTFALATTNSRNRRPVVLSSNEAPLRRESSGAASAATPSEKRGHSMAFNASTVRACKMLIATTFALAALGTGAQAYTPEQEQVC